MPVRLPSAMSRAQHSLGEQHLSSLLLDALSPLQLQATPRSRIAWLISSDGATAYAAVVPFVSAVLQHFAILSCSVNEQYHCVMVRRHLHAAD